MPPLRNSRYQYSTKYTDTSGQSFLTEPAPIIYEDSLDNIIHVVQGGERLQDLAHKYFAEFGSNTFPSAGLWYIIAQFQPTPIVDPTIKLADGMKLYIPSKRYVATRIFDPARRNQ